MLRLQEPSINSTQTGARVLLYFNFQLNVCSIREEF